MKDTGPSFITHYLTKSWSSGGLGPDEFNCYGLVQDVYKTQWDIDLPNFMVEADDLRTTVRTIGAELYKERWFETSFPEHGAIVLFSYRIAPTHVGIWLKYDGGVVLHSCKQLNITCTPVHVLKSYGFIRPRFFSYVERTPSK